MRIEGIEGTRLRALMRRQSGEDWLGSFVSKSSKRFTDDELVSGEDSLELVVLAYTLNFLPDLEARRAVIRQALELVKPGGTVVATARACDSGAELAERMVTAGVHPSKLGLSNLSNKEIACLRPKDAVFLSSTVTLRLNLESADESKARTLAFASLVRKSPIQPDLRADFPEQFTTKLLDIGLIWTR